MSESPSGSVTRFLKDWEKGDRNALDQMLPLVYDELRRLARYYLSRERPGHTLQPTALLHEAYLRLVDQRSADWKNRAQFLGLAASMMRRILLNHARDRAAAKRGGRAENLPLTIAVDAFEQPDIDVLVLHEALDRLAAIDLRKSQIVELKFFGGLTTDEITQVLKISSATVERDWTFARAWLYRVVTSQELSEA